MEQFVSLARIISLPRPSHQLAGTVLLSGATLLLGQWQGFPLWLKVLLALIPWLPHLASTTLHTYRLHGWLALFYLLVVTQGGHLLEHVAQMVQIHFLGIKPPHAHGVFGALDTEWVHLIWNSLVLLAALLLLARYRNNSWLWVVLPFALWHQVEHLYIMSIYLSGGGAGAPGLLAHGGRLGGGLPLIRPDLHFLYNVMETVPLIIAFLYQLRSIASEPDRWGTRAVPTGKE